MYQYVCIVCVHVCVCECMLFLTICVCHIFSKVCNYFKIVSLLPVAVVWSKGQSLLQYRSSHDPLFNNMMQSTFHITWSTFHSVTQFPFYVP